MGEKNSADSGGDQANVNSANDDCKRRGHFLELRLLFIAFASKIKAWSTKRINSRLSTRSRRFRGGVASQSSRSDLRGLHDIDDSPVNRVAVDTTLKTVEKACALSTRFAI
jgi:hypothetical protein